jgi:aminopeptidase 2
MMVSNYLGTYINCLPSLLLFFTKRLMALSQPTDARRALPCWDEPLLKATFSVTLVSRRATVSLSNMPARPDVAVGDSFTEALFDGVKDGSWHATSFDTTPPVSI